MLQIRLNKGSSGDVAAGGGGATAKPPLPSEIVMVACPEHLVLADLPVASSLGAVTASAQSSIRTVGRRSRRHITQKVHFCVRCDFPIAIYGRLVPCEHIFCLACTRSDPSCYLCDERIQKIQTIKMLEGVFICGAPHCLKSFLQRSEFHSHLNEAHSHLIQPNLEREGGNENTRLSSVEPHKPSLQPESSTARAPSRSGFSPGSNSQIPDREERPRLHQSRDPLPPLMGLPPYHPTSDNKYLSEKQTGVSPKTSSANYPPPLPPQPPSYPPPMNVNQTQGPNPSFSFPPFSTDGSQLYYAAPFENPRQESVPEGRSEHGSVLGIPPIPASPGIGSFPDSYPRPWGVAFMSQGMPEGLANPQGGAPFFQGNYGFIPEGSTTLNPPLPFNEPEHRNDGKGVLASLPIPFPALLPPHLSSGGMFSSSGGASQDSQMRE